MKSRRILWASRASICWMMFIFTPAISADVYKWVDEKGNVHFSDDPQDAGRGEQINTDSVNVMEGGEALAVSASKNRQRVVEQQVKAAEATTEAAFDPCKAGLEDYHKYSRVHHDANGVPFYYYFNNEDGTPMSQRDHDKMVSEMKTALERRGCL